MTNDYFCTYDLGLATGLLSAGFEISAMDRVEAKRFQFKFVDSPELTEAIDDYFSDKLDVSARQMYDNLKMLKNRIYNNL